MASSLNEKMTALADNIRLLSGDQNKLNLDSMAINLNNVSQLLQDESTIISQIQEKTKFEKEENSSQNQLQKNIQILQNVNSHLNIFRWHLFLDEPTIIAVDDPNFGSYTWQLTFDKQKVAQILISENRNGAYYSNIIGQARQGAANLTQYTILGGNMGNDTCQIEDLSTETEIILKVTMPISILSENFAYLPIPRI